MGIGATPIEIGGPPMRIGRGPIGIGGTPIEVGEAPIGMGEAPIAIGGPPMGIAEAPIKVGRSPIEIGMAPIGIGEAAILIGGTPVEIGVAWMEIGGARPRLVEGFGGWAGRSARRNGRYLPSARHLTSCRMRFMSSVRQNLCVPFPTERGVYGLKWSMTALDSLR